jgi:NADPH2:quinone reductase
LAVTRPQFVYPAPDDTSTWLTGALVVNYHTAYFALVRRANLKPGQTVLVHGAGGGLGQATIQVAKALGAQVLAVASSAEKQQAAAAAGADHVVASDDSWSARVRDLTDQHGVDVVIDPVGGQRFVESLRILGTEGRVVVVGFTSGEIPQAKVNRLLLQNTSVVGAAWREFVERDPEFGQLMARELNAMFNSGQIHAPLITPVSIDESAEAMLEVMNNRLVGRLSVRMHRPTG